MIGFIVGYAVGFAIGRSEPREPDPDERRIVIACIVIIAVIVMVNA